MDKLNEDISRIREVMGLEEATYNYHAGDLGADLTNLDKHGSDNIFRMQGRGTGHFGSGIYFSTYRLRDKADFDSEYGQYSNYRDNNPNLIQVKNRVYRIDFDIYKNLYRVNSNKHGELLFTTMRELNNIFYSYVHGTTDLSRWYLKLLNNFHHLSLKLPKYREFIKMMEVAKSDYNARFDKNSVNEVSAASFSTRMMEWNGYNGVNVSGIYDWDNLQHGSVIYDINKLDGEMQPVNFDHFINVDKYTGVAGDLYKDIKTRMLSSKPIFDDDIKKLNELSLDLAITLIKRYYNWVSYHFDLLRDELKKAYLNSLHKKLLDDSEMLSNMTEWDMDFLVDYGLFKIINDYRLKKGGESLLSHALYSLRYNDDRVKKVINNINRELDKDEQESLEMAKEII